MCKVKCLNRSWLGRVNGVVVKLSCVYAEKIKIEVIGRELFMGREDFKLEKQVISCGVLKWCRVDLSVEEYRSVNSWSRVTCWLREAYVRRGAEIVRSLADEAKSINIFRFHIEETSLL